MLCDVTPAPEMSSCKSHGFLSRRLVHVFMCAGAYWLETIENAQEQSKLLETLGDVLNTLEKETVYEKQSVGA